MHSPTRQLLIAAGLVLATAGTALAQSATPAAQPKSDGWHTTVYPIYAWIPLQIDIETNLPPDDGGGSGGGGSQGGKIVDGRFDAAYFGGVAVGNGTWQFDVNGLWAAVGGDRLQTPTLTVDADVYYGHGSVERKIVGDLFVTGGVRRMAVKYNIKLAGRTDFSRKPGVWDPLIGVAYHKVSKRYELHGTFDGGGFGVGADSDYGASARIDWKPIPHFGIAAGYSFLKFKLSDTVLNKTLVAEQTLSGPIVGIGLYF
jgi:hypothetical protein